MGICNLSRMSSLNKSVSFLTAIALCIWIVSTSATHAQSGQKQYPGTVLVANVVGKAEATRAGSNSSRSLKKRDTISEKDIVNVGDASTATLVFSNGATVKLLENTSLEISKFLQAPFSTPFAMPIATEEPTTSSTEMKLNKGEVVCKVKKLRTAEGSYLTVNTPVGAAGVRGTTFSVSYSPAADGGQGTYTLSVTEGSVEMTDANGNPTTVTAGNEIVITFTSTTDGDGNTTLTIADVVNQPITPARQLAINNAANDQEADNVIFEATDSGLLDAPGFVDAEDGGEDPAADTPQVTDPNP